MVIPKNGHEQGAAGARRSILVVEDEPLVRMLTVDIVEELGFRAEEAGSATEAMTKAASGGRFEAAIIDLGLPDRGGDSLAQELRAIRGDLPILITSGYHRSRFDEVFDGDRLVSFLDKPYLPDQLRQALVDLAVTGPATT